MAEKRKSYHSSPPPPPRMKSSPILIKSKHGKSETNTGKTDSPTSKLKPPSKQFKMPRAFSSGTVSLGKLGGWGKKGGKTKNNDAITPSPDDNCESQIGVSHQNRNGINIDTESGNEADALTPRKLTEIGFMPELKVTGAAAGLHLHKPEDNIPKDRRSATLPLSFSDSIPNRELPPLPDSDIPHRELPPLPDSDSTPNDPDSHFRELPPLPDDADTENLQPQPISSSSPGISRSYEEVEMGSKRLSFLPPTEPIGEVVKNSSPHGSGLTKYEKLSKSDDAFVKKSDEDASLDETSGPPKGDVSGSSDWNERVSPEAKKIHSQNNKTVSSISLPISLTTVNTNSMAEPNKDYTIGEIIDSYSYALPVRVRILQGYCSDTSDVNISTDDIYNIHAVQHTTMLMVKDEEGRTHRISYQAPVRIGLLYNPKNDYEESLNGYNFPTISDLTSTAVALPKLICATKTVTYGEEKNSVTEGEVFVIRHVHRSIFKGKKGLKVFSLLRRSNKVLLDDCQGHFTTKPSLVRMELPELLERVNDLYPQDAVIYPVTDSSNISSDFPGTLSRVVTLTECNTQTTLVVSDVSCMNEKALEEANLHPIMREEQNSFDLLLDDDVSRLEVAVLKWTNPNSDSKESLSRSLELKQNGVSPSKEISDGRHTYINLQQAAGQSAMTTTSKDSKEDLAFQEEDEDAGYDTVGLHLIRSDPPKPSHSSNESLDKATLVTPSNHEYSKVCHSKPPHSSNENIINKGTSVIPSDHEYSKVCHSKPPNENANKSTPVTPNNHEYSTVCLDFPPKISPESLPFPDHGYSTVSRHRTVNGRVIEGEPERRNKRRDDTQQRAEEADDGDQLSALMEGLESRFKLFQSAQQSVEMTKMQSMLESLTRKLESMDTQLNTLAASPSTVGQAKPVEPVEQEAPVVEKSEEELNREFLNSLSAQQVGEMMESMGLGQYKDKILEEQISGEILLECDDSVLQSELGVSSKIHRIRIMKLITGHHSAKTLLDNK